MESKTWSLSSPSFKINYQSEGLSTVVNAAADEMLRILEAQIVIDY